MKHTFYRVFRLRHRHDGGVRIGLAEPGGNVMFDLTAVGLESLTDLLEDESRIERLEAFLHKHPPELDESMYEQLAPVEMQEIWAAGVTYQRSKTARMEESDFSANAYDMVYDADRPELFFKATPEKVVGPESGVGIRRDAEWNVPEPELVLVYNSKREMVGCTLGNDMSSRDIEGENLLYLPQAKVYAQSCAIGPCIVVGVAEEQAREWEISIRICRDKTEVFAGSTSINQIKRSFADLGDYLWRSQVYPRGVMLLTGTGIVPGDDFTLRQGDRVSISIEGIGVLSNPVEVV